MAADASSLALPSMLAAGCNSKLHTAGGNPEWNFRDFFNLNSADEHLLKKALALHFKIRYDSTGMGEPVANAPPYKPDDMTKKKKHAEILTSLGEAGTSGKQKEVLENSLMATVINGCLVKWNMPGKNINTGYIESWAQKNLGQWDRSIERCAGGLYPCFDFAAQHLVVSNASSMYAMIATVVHDFLVKGKVDERLANAFQSIRVNLFLFAAGDEIELLNAEENVAQQDRKIHTELDNIGAIEMWMHAMKTEKKTGSHKGSGCFQVRHRSP